MAEEPLYADRCFVCWRTVEPREVWRNPDLNGHDVARAFYTCVAEHDLPHVDWWTDWRDFSVLERIRITDPSMGDVNAGTTWSGTPLPPSLYV